MCILEETLGVNTALKQECVARHELLKMSTGRYLCGKAVFQRIKEQPTGKDRNTEKTICYAWLWRKEQRRYGKGRSMMLWTGTEFRGEWRKKQNKISDSEAMPCSQ